MQKKKAYHVEGLPQLCGLVANSAGLSIAANHPLVGRAIFTSESGLHVHGLLKDPASYEPFPPERLNTSRTLLLGAKTGAGAVAGYLAKIGLPQSEQAMPQMLRRIRLRATELGRPLHDPEIRALI